METKTLDKNFDVQSVGINANFSKVFGFIAKPQNLPLWTKAFSVADDSTATMVTPQGELNVGLEVAASEKFGTIDWYMTMPDGNIGKAFSRITENADGNSIIYTFVLLAPPGALAELEGALSAQKQLLAEELLQLKELLEKS